MKEEQKKELEKGLKKGGNGQQPHSFNDESCFEVDRGADRLNSLLECAKNHVEDAKFKR